MKKVGNNRGFTLMEMVTTIAIISILIVTGVPAFMAYARHNSVRITAQDMKSFLLEAQNLAKNPRPKDKEKDYYYVRIDFRDRDHSTMELGTGLFNPSTGRPMSWQTDSKIRRIGEEAIKERQEISSEAEVLYIKPQRLDPKISTFIYIIPTGKMMIDFHEPYPGLGYSPKCENISQCWYFRQPINRNARICLWLKDGKSYEDYLKHNITIDGHGGDVEIKEGICDI